ncbi:hypothetical protein [Shimia sp. R9_3]|uniref:beta strand repeat-containing protein n=1 Tax=Shimia sp. R9_3 TaxID=2821113 RepID=UPI001ADB0756|nr:hypothetical protein [Shimia sp. R9_3]MBO9403337.1 hypothetical protein [Shimia sp. R9_3]
MLREQNKRAVARGGRLTKFKGKVASVAPSLFLGTVSLMALSVGVGSAEVVSTARTTPLVSSVDEDHTITSTGSIDVSPLSGSGLVVVNVADYTSNLTNDGLLSSAEGINRTRAAVDLNGDLSGSVVNSGTITMGAAAGDSANLNGIDIQGDVQGALENSGTITIENSALTFGTAAGIKTNATSGTLINSGTIDVDVDVSSKAIADGIRSVTVDGTLINTGVISVAIETSSGSTLSNVDGIQIDTVTGDVVNSGTIEISAISGAGNATGDGIEISYLPGRLTNAGAIRMQIVGENGATADVVEIFDVSGDFENSGALSVDTTSAKGGAFFDVIEVGDLTGSVNNSGAIFGAASGTTAGVDGLDIGEISSSATLTNSGTVSVEAIATVDGAFADALDFYDILGNFENSGDLEVKSTGVTRVGGRGIETDDIGGVLSNTGSISVATEATSGSATATGLQLEDVSGTVTHQGALTVSALSTSGSEAIGIEVDTLTGALQNDGAMAITASGGNPTAQGILVQDIGSTGALANTGDIALNADNASSGEAYGISALNIEGALTNSGNVNLSLDANSHATAYGIDARDVSGVLTNSGTINMNVQGSSIEVGGVRLSNISGTVTNTGSIQINTDGSSARVEGISANTVSGTLQNHGTIDITATNAARANLAAFGVGNTSGDLVNTAALTIAVNATSFARAIGLDGSDVSGALSNSGTIAITASGTSAAAEGINLNAVSGMLENSGSISVQSIGVSPAHANGIDLNDIGGQVTNSGSIQALADGAFAFADGIEMDDVSGQFENTANLTVAAVGTSLANAAGLEVDNISGLVSNSGTLQVSATNAGFSSAYAAGVEMRDIGTGGVFSNSGTISVVLDAGMSFGGSAYGVDGGIIDGALENTGTISVATSGTGPVSADGLRAAQVSTGGALTHSGTIQVSADGAASEAYGIRVDALQGSLLITGDVSATAAAESYAVYLGNGGGTLNIETSANVDGTIRVSDHDVNLTNVGGRLVYRFEDADTVQGVFTTKVSGANEGWFVEDEGGAAPVYTSYDAEEAQPNTHQSFEIASLSYGLARQLQSITGPSDSGVQSVISTKGSLPLEEGFRPYFVISGSQSDSDAGSSAAGLSSNMWSASAGVTRDLGTGLRFGLGASYLENNGTFGTASFDTSGVVLSGILAKDYGFADLSFGLGYGHLDHEETRIANGSEVSAGYSSNILTALVAAQRDHTLANGAVFTPQASFLYGYHDLGGYTETGGITNATVGERNVQFNETRLGGSYATSLAGGKLSASLAAVHRDADAPSAVDVTIFGNTLVLASGGSESEIFGEVGLGYQRAFDHGGSLNLEARSTVGSDVSTQALWATYEWRF